MRAAIDHPRRQTRANGTNRSGGDHRGRRRPRANARQGYPTKISQDYGDPFKPYPCNHFTHAGVDAALRLRAQGLAPADVTAIELGVAKPVLRTIAEPPEAKARPASGYHAAFSGPYTVAAALLGGGLGVSHEDFTDAAARDPRRLALAALVRCVEDERCSASFPHAFPAVLRVTTRTGEELEARVEVNRGGPGNPLSDEELARKFHDNAVRSLPEERAAELAARTLALPDAQSVEDLTALLTSAGER